MRVPRLRLAALALVSGIALSGCAYDMYGNDYGYGYGPYGSLGVGYGGYGYGGYGYSPYGYGYGPYGYGYDPFGWYGGYYYPGSGIYVYDRDRHPRVMTDDQKRHWREVMQRLNNRSTTTTTATTATSVAPRENWSGFNRGRARTSDSTAASPGWGRGRWSRDSSSTTTSSETTTTTRSNNGWHGRGHKHDD
jgi:hypothetical protein